MEANKVTEKVFTPLKKLFSTKQESIPASAAMSNPVNAQANTSSETKREGETYQQWGTRICGIVSGGLDALPPFLQKVYNCIYKEQADNTELQNQLVVNKRAEIAQKEAEIESIQNKSNRKEGYIVEKQERIDELKKERSEIKAGKKQVNYEHLPSFIIGLIILLPLTCYLFLFYSSTFYSAFFRNAEDMGGVANAMFASNALANASNNGVTELLFVLLAPIIFMGLGFILHVFSEQKKYTNVAGILLVTVMFDCILAFKIGDQLHTFNMMIGNLPIGTPYGMHEAIGDINTWAVIFCGFIAYVIWGIVFDSVMSAYKKMDFNRTRIKEIDAEIQIKEEDIANVKADIASFEDSMGRIRREIQKLTGEIGNTVNIDYAAIKTEMNNFYAGWVIQMKVLERPDEEQNRAKDLFENMIQSINDKANN